MKYLFPILLIFLTCCNPYLGSHSTGSLFVKASEGCFRGPFNISTKTLGSKWGEKLDIEFFVKNAGSYRVSVLQDGKLVRTLEFGKKAAVNECPAFNEEDTSGNDNRLDKNTPPLKRTKAHFIAAWNEYYKVTYNDQKNPTASSFSRFSFTLIDHRITDPDMQPLKADIPIKVIVWSVENTDFRDFYAKISQHEYVPSDEKEYRKYIQKKKK